VNYRYAKPKKFNFSFGGNFSSADFTRTDRRVDTSVHYNFTNLFPRANLNYTLPNSGNLRFNYYGNTRAPSIDQIQPVKDNTDELNQRIGNPNLKQSFSQSFNLNYNKYVLIGDQYMSAGVNYGTTKNAFSSISFVDALGKRITQPTNVNGNHYYGARMYYTKKLGTTPIRLGGSLDASKNFNTNYVNNLINNNKSTDLEIGPSFSWDKAKKFEINIYTGINYVKSVSSIRPDEPTQYWTQNYNVRGLIFLPWKLELSSDASINIRQRTDAFDKNRNAIQWNAGLTKKILKDKGQIRLSMSDILNQNIGFQRDVTSNFINERTYNRIQRYGLLTFIYNFSKNGKPQSW
ncbi:MAG: outer membrane beta-barrel protein, partial [Chitinophagaceae bacterium]